MLYIQKMPALPEVTNEIERVKRDVGWNKQKEIDPDFARATFDLLNKSIIRNQLSHEQKDLCAYCMRRIKDDSSTVIEHLIPISEAPEKALQYENMMACCDGGRGSKSMPHVLCCDASKGDKSISIDPHKADQMKRIRYRFDGMIYLYPDNDPQLTEDINDTLRLNGEIDKDGNLINDTSTQLVYGRRQIYRNYERFVRGISQKGNPVAPAIRKKIKELMAKTSYDEYTGVWIYFLNRKLKSIPK